MASGHHDARSDEEARACDLRRARTAEAADEDDAGRQIGEQLGAEMRGSRKAGWEQLVEAARSVAQRVRTLHDRQRRPLGRLAATQERLRP